MVTNYIFYVSLFLFFFNILKIYLLKILWKIFLKKFKKNSFKDD